MAIRLYILSPTTIFAARVNQSTFTYPLADITFDTVTVGAFGDVKPGMLALFGTTAGADDLGRQRIRAAATSTVLKIGRSSRGNHDGEVSLADNVFVTVVNFFPVYAKMPFFSADASEPPIITIFKDHDIAVSTNTTTPPPVANAGAPAAGTIDSGTSKLRVQLPHTANTSFAVADGATISSYAWVLPTGVTLVGGYALTDSVIQVDCDPGFYYISLTVTDSNGKTHTARTFIYARNPASDTTIETFQIESHRIAPKGQEISLRILEDIPASQYIDGTLVVLFDGEPSGPTDRSNLLFWGWLHNEPATIASQRTGTLQDTVLQCLDVAGKLDALPCFNESIENDAYRDTSKVTAITWTFMTTPNVDKMMHYLLEWHSTALEVADWTNTGTGATYAFRILFGEGNSIFDQVNRMAESLKPSYHLTCNTLGQLLTKVDPMLQDTGDRTATVQATLAVSDWSAVRYTHQRAPRIRQFYLEAILVDADTISSIFSVAPGDAPGQGQAEQTDGNNLAVSQTVLNAVAGHAYARLNAPQSKFQVTFAQGDDLDIEPANMTWVRLTISAALAAQRGLAFTTARGLVHEINIRYAHERTGLVRTVELTWERETSGEAGITDVQDEVEPVDPTEAIPAPDLTTPPTFGDPDVYYDPVKGYVLWDGAHIMRTWDVLVASPVWELIDTGISGSIRDIQYVHTGPSTVGAWAMTSTAIFWCADIMATTPAWSSVLTITTVRATDEVPVTGDVHFKCMAHYPGQPGHLCVATGPMSSSNQNLDYEHAYFYVTTNYGASWTHVDMGYLIDTTGGIRGYHQTGQYALAAFHTPPGTLYCVRSAPHIGSTRSVWVFKSTNLGLSWAGPPSAVAQLNVPTSSDLLSYTIMHPFPSATDPMYATGGALATDLCELYMSEEEFTDTAQVNNPAGPGEPTGYVGIARLWRPNKRTFDNDHIIAWFQEDATDEYHLLQSEDKGSTWALLYDSNLTGALIPGTGLDTNISTSRHNTPNGWPANEDVWFLVRGNVTSGSVTNAIMSTEDNFATAPVSRVGNLASILPGGATGWTNGSAGGIALPRLGVNA